MVYQIPGALSFISDITGRIYATKKRAEAAEKASERMKLKAEELAPIVPDDVVKDIPWDSLPGEIRADRDTWDDWLYDHVKGSADHFSEDWETWDLEKMLAFYGVDDDTTAVVDLYLKGSDLELRYVQNADGTKRWKLFHKDSKIGVTEDHKEEVLELLADYAEALAKGVMDVIK